MRFLLSRALLAAGLAFTLSALVTAAEAKEVQLAGIRLGDHAITLLDVYGTPDGIAVGEGDEIAAAQAPGAAAGAPQMAAPDALGALAGALGAMPGMEGMMGGMPGPAAGPGMPGMPGMEGGAAGAFPGGAPGAEAGMGAPGGAAGPGGEGGGVTAGGLQTEPFPIWAMAVWVDLGAGDVEWVYNEGPVVLGFVLDRNGFVKVVAVAAEKCNFARTALWRPHRYIKLGDDFKRVIYRYGYPDETLAFNSSGPGTTGVGGGDIAVTFGPTTRTYSRDVLLRYTNNNNIEFSLHDMVVTRIHIWE
ncbi:MAG: hypothetical protein ABFD94_18795 [Armatimonadia bacterium]